jgi:hypothetical protein
MLPGSLCLSLIAVDIDIYTYRRAVILLPFRKDASLVVKVWDGRRVMEISHLAHTHTPTIYRRSVGASLRVKKLDFVLLGKPQDIPAIPPVDRVGATHQA